MVKPAIVVAVEMVLLYLMIQAYLTGQLDNILFGATLVVKPDILGGSAVIIKYDIFSVSISYYYVSTSSLLCLFYSHTCYIRKHEQSAVLLYVFLMNQVHSMQLHQSCNYN